MSPLEVKNQSREAETNTSSIMCFNIVFQVNQCMLRFDIRLRVFVVVKLMFCFSQMGHDTKSTLF